MAALLCLLALLALAAPLALVAVTALLALTAALASSALPTTALALLIMSTPLALLAPLLAVTALLAVTPLLAVTTLLAVTALMPAAVAASPLGYGLTEGIRVAAGLLVSVHVSALLRWIVLRSGLRRLGVRNRDTTAITDSRFMNPAFHPLDNATAQGYSQLVTRTSQNTMRHKPVSLRHKPVSFTLAVNACKLAGSLRGVARSAYFLVAALKGRSLRLLRSVRDQALLEAANTGTGWAAEG